MTRNRIILAGIGVSIAAGLTYFFSPKHGESRRRKFKKRALEIGLQSAEKVYLATPSGFRVAAQESLRRVSVIANGKEEPNGTVYSNGRTNKRLRFGIHVARALLSTSHPLLVHIVPMRRCNLACTYCNEYDHKSQPIELEEMHRRIDRLAELGTSIVTLSGGEPMMHPQVYEIIARIREHGMIAGLITNGTYLQRENILRLNSAGLDELQISIDNVNPDSVSQKSLKLLDGKLVNLTNLAKFRVNINSVLGSGVDNPADALVIATRARELGFSSTVGIIHGSDGSIKDGLEKGLSPYERSIYKAIKSLPQPSYSSFNKFQDELVAGNDLSWRCRAGARYLYIDENGIVSWCSQQRGTPGLPLLQYKKMDLEREYITEKYCAPKCTILCVHQISIPDKWRDPQITLKEFKDRTTRDIKSSEKRPNFS